MLTSRAAAAICALLVSLSVSSAAAAGDAIPRDFRLTAEYYPPLPDFGSDVPGVSWHRWMLTVTANGKALQETQRSPRGSTKGISRRSVRLARSDLERLVATARASNFHLLAADYAFKVSPAAALVLRITLDGRSHEVTVYAPDTLPRDAEVAAFLRIWNEVVVLVPPPNRGQGTE